MIEVIKTKGYFFAGAQLLPGAQPLGPQPLLATLLAAKTN